MTPQPSVGTAASSAQVLAAVQQAAAKYAANGGEPPQDDKKRLLLILRQHGRNPAIAKAVQSILRLDDKGVRAWRLLSDRQFRLAVDWESTTQMGPESNVIRDLGTRGRDWTDYPTHGFFGDYLEFTLCSRSPLSLHFWAAVTVMSAACGRRYALNRGHYNLYPSVPVVMIADSGAGKTEACRPAIDMINAVGSVHYLADRISPEALVLFMKSTETVLSEEMRQDPETGDLSYDGDRVSEGFLYAEELPTLLSGKRYAEGTTDDLSKLFDCPPEHSRNVISKDGQLVRRTVALNPCLGFLAGVTPDKFRTSIPEDAHTQGFMSRVAWIRRDRTDRTVPKAPPPSPYLLERCLLHLRKLRSIDRIVDMGLSTQDGADRWFLDWYKRHHPRLYQVPGELRGYINRKETFLLRLAAIFALAEDEPKYAIRRDHLEMASSILDAEEESIFQITLSVTHNPKLQQNLERCRRLMGRLTSESKCPTEKGRRYVLRSRIQREFGGRCNARDLTDLLETMVDAEELRKLKNPRQARPGRSGERYALGVRFPKEHIPKPKPQEEDEEPTEEEAE